MLQGIFADDSQIAYGEGSVAAQLAPALEQRLESTLEEFHAFLLRRPQTHDPALLTQSLRSARWSI
jgi:FMN reductase